MQRARYVPQTAQQARDLAAAARREIAKLPPRASYEAPELTAHRRQLWAIRDQADKLADDLARTAPRPPKPPTMLQRITGKKRDTRLTKYSPDQRRDDDGRFADEGKGGGGGLGRTAAAGAGLLAAGALATPQGRALAAAGLLRTAAAARASNLAAMRAERAAINAERAKLDARLQRMAAGATPSASRASGVRAAVRRGANRIQTGAYHADAAAERRVDRAVERLPLPPRAREAVRNELRHGSSGPDPAGKLIEPPSWLLGLFH